MSQGEFDDKIAPLHATHVAAYLIPEIQHDDSLRNPITTTIDKNLIDEHLLQGSRCGLRMYDLDVAVIPLVCFGNLYRRSIVLWDTPFRKLERP
jgi:hypothetical protein